MRRKSSAYVSGRTAAQLLSTPSIDASVESYNRRRPIQVVALSHLFVDAQQQRIYELSCCPDSPNSRVTPGNTAPRSSANREQLSVRCLPELWHLGSLGVDSASSDLDPIALPSLRTALMTGHAPATMTIMEILWVQIFKKIKTRRSIRVFYTWAHRVHFWRPPDSNR